MEPYEELANAIIIQAANDYMNALKTLKLSPKNYEARQTKRECEEFFLSSWFRDLTDADGKTLMNNLKMEVK